MQNCYKLNLGCGDDILEGYINADKYNPAADMQFDALHIPFPDNYFEEIFFHHVIEHISHRLHNVVLTEIRRVLKPGGSFILGFPDFVSCAKAFIENKHGKRWSWWMYTLYGLQTHEGQFHVAPITVEYLTEKLFEQGFGSLNFIPAEDGFNYSCKCIKAEPLPWFEEEWRVKENVICK